jgi:hypothetical protein
MNEKNTTQQLMQGFLRELLSTLTIPTDVLVDAIAATEPEEPTMSAMLGPTELLMRVKGEEPFYPIEVKGSASKGIFLLRGFNNKGKTTSIITASILLGIDWDDERFHEFLQHEERYISAGQSFQRELEEGTREAAFKISRAVSHIDINVKQGQATVEVDGNCREFNISAEGWRIYREYIRSYIQAEFIPQRRDYLRHVYLEVADELRQRLAKIETYYLEKKGKSIRGKDEQERRAYLRALEERQAKLQLEKKALEQTEGKITLLERIREASLNEPLSTQRIIERARLQQLIESIDRLKRDIASLRAEVLEATQENQRQLNLHAIAYPALERLVDEVERIQPNLRSRKLLEKVGEIKWRKEISGWLNFRVTNAYGDSGLYSDLYSALTRGVDSGLGAKRTFPFRDDVFERDVATVEELKELLGEYRTWSRDFFQLLAPILDRFYSQVQGCNEIANKDLDQLYSNLTARSHIIEIQLRALSEKQVDFAKYIEELRLMLNISDTANEDTILSASRKRFEELEPNRRQVKENRRGNRRKSRPKDAHVR